MPVIDAHQHFWDPARIGSYPWLSGAYAPIRRRFGIEDLVPALRANGVDGTILVQAENSLDETHACLRTAAANPCVLGVVGWVDLTDPAVARRLAELKAGPGGGHLVGIRHLLHEEADPNWIMRHDVGVGLAAVAEAGLVYDLVGTTLHLPAMIRAVEHHPNLRFVLDHIAKPGIREGVFEPWASTLRTLATHRAHVWCKLSGLITEADWTGWRVADLVPYVRHALDAFGARRCLFGSDWPVCLVAGQYKQVVEALRECLDGTEAAAMADIFGGTAAEVYGFGERLRPPPA